MVSKTPSLATTSILGKSPSIELQQNEKGNYLMSGDLEFSTVKDILLQSQALFEAGSNINVDLAGVERADSAGLAVLVEWLGMAKRFKKTLKYDNIPEQIQVIARASGLEDILMP